MSLAMMKPSIKADWSGTISVLEGSTGEAVDCSDMVDLLIEVEDPDTRTAVLTASLGNGVTAVDAATGEFTFTFTAAQMASLKPKSYLFGGIIKDATQTLQLFAVRVSTYEGVVG